MRMTLDLPKGWVFGFYPETGNWECVAQADYPDEKYLARLAGYNPRCTMLRCGDAVYDCEDLKAAFP